MATQEEIDLRLREQMREQLQLRGVQMQPPEETRLEVEMPDRECLLGFLRRRLPSARALALSELTLIGYGTSREHYAFDLAWESDEATQGLPLILMRDAEFPPLPIDRRREFRLLKRLERTPVPAPRALWCDAAGRWLKRPFLIMERLSGSVTPSFCPAYPDDPELRRQLADGFIDVLVMLHCLDWRKLGLGFMGVPECSVADYASYRVSEAQAMMAEAEVLTPAAHPVVARALAWCKQRAPVTQALVLCHGDYKTDNVMYEGGRIVAIIDWELARIGDPIEELSYICLPFLSNAGLAVGMVDRDHLLERYQREAGFRAGEGDMLFWEVLHNVQFVYYFSVLIEVARRRGTDPSLRAVPSLESLISYLLGAIEGQLAQPVP